MFVAHPLDMLGREANDERRPVEVRRAIPGGCGAAVARYADGLEAGVGSPAHRQPVDGQGAGRDDLDVGDVGGEHGAGDHRARPHCPCRG